MHISAINANTNTSNNFLYNYSEVNSLCLNISGNSSNNGNHNNSNFQHLTPLLCLDKNDNKVKFTKVLRKPSKFLKKNLNENNSNNINKVSKLELDDINSHKNELVLNPVISISQSLFNLKINVNKNIKATKKLRENENVISSNQHVEYNNENSYLNYEMRINKELSIATMIDTTTKMKSNSNKIENKDSNRDEQSTDIINDAKNNKNNKLFLKKSKRKISLYTQNKNNEYGVESVNSSSINSEIKKTNFITAVNSIYLNSVKNVKLTRNNTINYHKVKIKTKRSNSHVIDINLIEFNDEYPRIPTSMNKDLFKNKAHSNTEDLVSKIKRNKQSLLNHYNLNQLTHRIDHISIKDNKDKAKEIKNNLKEMEIRKKNRHFSNSYYPRNKRQFSTFKTSNESIPKISKVNNYINKNNNINDNLEDKIDTMLTNKISFMTNNSSDSSSEQTKVLSLLYLNKVISKGFSYNNFKGKKRNENSNIDEEINYDIDNDKLDPIINRLSIDSSVAIRNKIFDGYIANKSNRFDNTINADIKNNNIKNEFDIIKYNESNNDNNDRIISLNNEILKQQMFDRENNIKKANRINTHTNCDILWKKPNIVKSLNDVSKSSNSVKSSEYIKYSSHNDKDIDNDESYINNESISHSNSKNNDNNYKTDKSNNNNNQDSKNSNNNNKTTRLIIDNRNSRNSNNNNIYNINSSNNINRSKINKNNKSKISNNNNNSYIKSNSNNNNKKIYTPKKVKNHFMTLDLKNFSNKNKEKILIIEDSPILKNTLKKQIEKIVLLNNLNVEVIVGSDGVDLLKLIVDDQSKGNLVKLVISDENMEYMNGSEVLSILNKYSQLGKIKNSPVFICSTAFDDNDTFNYLKKIGLTNIIDKNTSYTKLEKIVLKYM